MSTTARKLVGVVVALTIAIPLVLLLFIAPASKSSPRDLPIGVAGPPAAVDQVTAMLDTRQPGAFQVQGYADPAELTAAAGGRDVYGGFVVGPAPQTVIATGASPAVATMLTQIGDQIAAQTGGAAEIIEVAAPAEGDPRGAGFGSMVMPVFMAGVALGAAVTLVGRRRGLIAAILPIGALAVGAAAVGAATWIGVLDGSYLLEWTALSAGILAIAATVAGLVSVVGMPGIGLGVLLFMLVGMPLAGIAAPPEFLPWYWGDLGQMLPLGATGTALRSAAFFDGAGSLVAYLVLGVWIVIGYLLLAVTRSAPEPTEEAVDESVLTPV